MADSIDKLPLGIYKSIMSKAIRTLNQPVLYVDERLSLLPSVLKATETYSPLRNTDYDVDEIRRRNATIKHNKKHNIKSRESFMIDYLKSLTEK